MFFPSFFRYVIAAVSAAFLCVLPAYAQDNDSFLGAKTFTLANGMQGIVVENHRAPAVITVVQYRVGAADDPAGKAGLAHMLEHLMVRGTSDEEFANRILHNGGNSDAFTQPDSTKFVTAIPVDQLLLVLEMEADRMRNLTVEETGLEAERKVVMEERRQSVERQPSMMLFERMMVALWKDHPYRNMTWGRASEIAGYTRQDVLDFYRQWYHPENAVLVVIGDVSVDQVQSLAEKTFGKIPKGPEVKRQRAQDIPLTVATKIEVRHPQVKWPVWQRFYRAPGLNVPQSYEDVLVLEILSRLLNDSSVSPFHKSLVIDQKIAASVQVLPNDSFRGDESLFSVQIVPAADVPPERIEAAFEAELDRFLQEGVSDQEIENIKRSTLRELDFLHADWWSLYYFIVNWLTAGGTVEQLEHRKQDIEKITSPQVMAVARKILRNDRAVTGLLLPESH